MTASRPATRNSILIARLAAAVKAVRFELAIIAATCLIWGANPRCAVRLGPRFLVAITDRRIVLAVGNYEWPILRRFEIDTHTYDENNEFVQPTRPAIIDTMLLDMFDNRVRTASTVTPGLRLDTVKSLSLKPKVVVWLFFAEFWIPIVVIMGVASVRLVSAWFYRLLLRRRHCCPKCGYPSYGLPTHICPECGEYVNDRVSE